MKKVLSFLFIVALLGVGFWLWTVFFPNPKEQVRNHLNKVARLASFSSSDGNITRVASVQRLGNLFAPDVQVIIDLPNAESHAFNGREELMQAAMVAKRFANGLKAEFLDMNIEMGTGNDSALVDLTLKAKVAGESDLIVQELKFTLKKSDGGTWYITRVETVRTLKP